jgi:hypothetical protein
LKANFAGKCVLQGMCFCVDSKSKMAVAAGHNLNIEPFGIMENKFSINLIEPKLYTNFLWMVPYNMFFVFVFVDLKFICNLLLYKSPMRK